MTDQERMERYLDKSMDEINIDQKDIICGLMKPEKVGCSYEEKSITLAFPVQEWQANRAGLLHGGMICTAFDMTAATLARFYAEEFYVPTISLDIKYIRPVKIGEIMDVTVSAVAAGRRIIQVQGKAMNRETGKLLATVDTVFLNADTAKERIEK